jgi:ribosomal protein S18 acetylase RimI-like enzyme
MNIRIANTGDIEKILILEEQILELHSKTRTDWIDSKKRPFNYEFLKNCIESNNGQIFIAENENKIIGHCILNINEIKNHNMFYDMLNIEIKDICIDEKYRNKGIGKKIFEKIKEFAKEKDAKFIELSVWEFNQNAIKFYEHLGMKTRLRKMELKIE